MGISNSGCLGLGPLLTQTSPPKIVQTLTDLKVKALSVSCGRKHTLVLTDFGVIILIFYIIFVFSYSRCRCMVGALIPMDNWD